MVRRASLFALGLACLFGCAAVGPFEDDCVSDGGPDGGDSLVGCPGRGDLDAGLAPPVTDEDGGELVEDPGNPACRVLVEDVCGVGEPAPCKDAPACVAATLLEKHVPEDCEAALSNDVSYPECRPGPCALLVDRVCGGDADDAACRDAPGCEPARVLDARSSSADANERAEAEASCNAALEDDVVFAACG